MNLELLKRRAEMLDAVSTGLHPSAVVSQLTGECRVSEWWSETIRIRGWG